MSYALLVNHTFRVNPDLSDRAMERYRMIEPYLEGACSLAAVATEADITLRTAQRWVERYRTDGVASLARRKRVDQGSKRVISGACWRRSRVLRWKGPEYPLLRSTES